MNSGKNQNTAYVSTTNACKLCKPLGACLAFRGVEGAVPFLHGSQGCATYMRRYIISHYREPIDIASSSLGEKQAVYGGGPNLKQGLSNVMSKYGARLIGVATTCLTETIGDDVPGIVREFCQETAPAEAPAQPEIVTVSTPSYAGTHMEGFHAAVKALVEQLAQAGEPRQPSTCCRALCPRRISAICGRCWRISVCPASSSRTCRRPWTARRSWTTRKFPPGARPWRRSKLWAAPGPPWSSAAPCSPRRRRGAPWKTRFGVPRQPLGLPLGLRETDRFFRVLEETAGGPPRPAHPGAGPPHRRLCGWP